MLEWIDGLAVGLSWDHKRGVPHGEASGKAYIRGSSWQRQQPILETMDMVNIPTLPCGQGHFCIVIVTALYML